ncbi:MAG: hypothetical protein ACO1RT_06920 [Planctomycetaceae bacterium]
MTRLSVLSVIFLAAVMRVPVRSQDFGNQATPYAAWPNGIPSDPSYFPLAVWLQSPRNAERFKDAGINLYVGLHRGPTEEQLTALKRVGMRVVCAQNETALGSENADIIVAWMHGDEPDNAQPKKSGGYGPPIDPSEIEKDYRQIQMRDATRPVFLNLGQGVAYDNYIGRGVRRNHPEDYALYIRGSDIVSFDIYPAVHDKPEVAGKLEFVPRGVERLRLWSKDEKIVWNCIEASRISNTAVKPTPQQIRSEVWMSLIQGSRGIIYFVHQFEPKFIEASLLEDSGLLSAVTEINRTITSLAPVLNSATVDDAVAIESAGDETPLSVMCKRHDGALYLFVANMSANKASAKLRFLNPLAGSAQAVTIEKSSPVAVGDGHLNVDLDGYGIGLYRVSGEQVAP